MLQPLLVGALGPEQVGVPLNRDPGFGQDARELLSPDRGR